LGRGGKVGQRNFGAECRGNIGHWRLF
jgi:hypothetical protein